MDNKKFRSKGWTTMGLAVVLSSLAVLSLGIAGCGASATPLPVPTAVREMAPEKMVEVEQDAAAPAPPPMEAPTGAGLPPASNLAASSERMIVRTADLAIMVEDTQAALLHIRDVASGLNGYIVDANLWRSDSQLRGNVSIRVPAESFDRAMDQIKGLALEVERENISAQDVTEEYTDLSARLRNLEATEEELLALLTEVRERTRNAEDVLAVHRELTNIRGQIEQIKGRMQYLERVTALATINVELIPKEEEKPIVEAGWQPLRTLRDASRALVNAGQFLVDAAIWLVVFVLPVLLVLILPLVIIILLWRRWRRRRATEQAS
ncbi:MAG: hypothetical protein Kow0063_44220 [Anaerolineae bacterium]